MRMVAVLALSAALSGVASVAAQQQTAQPPIEGGFLSDQGAPSLFDPPERDRFNPDGTPSNTVPRFVWLRADSLFWFVKRQIVPPLIQTIPDNLADATSLPANSASTLYPQDGKHISYNAFAGLRLNTGFWFTSEQRFGLDGSYFMLGQNSNGVGYVSSGSPALARFYVNANNNVLTNLQFSNPNPATGYSGSLAAASSLAPMWSADLSLRWNGYAISSENTDLLFGGRYFEMRESMRIQGQANLTGTTLNVNDYFKVSNQFFGGQIGMHARWGGYRGFTVDGIFKVAIGGIDQRVTIRGDNTLTSGGVSTTQQTGLYAQASNIGMHERGKIAFLPEATINLNYNFTSFAAVFVGYNFLYVSSVMRVGNAVNENVNDSTIRYIANQTPGNAAGPVFRYNAESFWLQGVNVGLRLEY